MFKLNEDIDSIDSENRELKYKLLSLIDDYKLLKQFVINDNHEIESKKRSYNEVEHEDSILESQSEPLLLSQDIDFTKGRSQSPDDSLSLVLMQYQPKNGSNNHPRNQPNNQPKNQPNLHTTNATTKPTTNAATTKSTTKPTDNDLQLINELDVLNIITDDLIDEEVDEMDSPLLSRTSSPSEVDSDNSLMSSLTRSTTLSTTVSNDLLDKNLQFFDLPKFAPNSNFSFEKNFSSILEQDQYNMVNDFLEEKLIDNDLNYYENLNIDD